MTYTDDNHQVAKLLKEFDERISDLEEKSRTDTNPNLLRTQRARLAVADAIGSVTTKDVETATWGDETDTAGYQTAAWGDLCGSLTASRSTAG